MPRNVLARGLPIWRFVGMLVYTFTDPLLDTLHVEHSITTSTIPDLHKTSSHQTIWGSGLGSCAKKGFYLKCITLDVQYSQHQSFWWFLYRSDKLRSWIGTSVPSLVERCLARHWCHFHWLTTERKFNVKDFKTNLSTVWNKLRKRYLSLHILLQ